MHDERITYMNIHVYMNHHVQSALQTTERERMKKDMHHTLKEFDSLTSLEKYTLNNSVANRKSLQIQS